MGILRDKKVLVFAVFFLVLTLSLSAILSSAELSSDAVVVLEDQILDTLEETGEVRILVKLKDSSKTTDEDLGERKEAIEKKQKDFVSDLKKDFSTLDVDEKKQAKIAANFGVLSEEEIAVEKNVVEKKKKEVAIEVEHEYETINALALTVTDEGALEEIAKNKNVEAVFIDYPVKVKLDESVSQINGDAAWSLQISGQNITGAGETVCVIDTGIEYTHSAFGSCNPTNYTTSGVIENITPIESDHDYANNEDVTFVINRTTQGYTNIAAHFVNISLETPGGSDTTDRIYVYDQTNTTIAVYKGSLEDVWTPSANGSVLYVRLVSDSSVTDYGFYIDQTINGTTNTTVNWSTCDKVIGGYDTYNNDADPMDDHGHGTHVSGIIASEDSTYKGLAPDATLVSIKALGASGSGWSSDVAAGIDWCTSNAERLNISVISMSLGCDGASCTHYQSACPSDISANAVDAAYAQGIVTVIATGNRAWTDGVANPACIANAVPVGSVTSTDAISSFTNRGDLLRLMAPGNSITSAGLSGTFVSRSGTSMATPHVSAAAALLKQYWRLAYSEDISPDAIEDKFAFTGALIEDTANSGNNYSRIDVLAALQPYLNYSSSSLANASSQNSSSVFVNVSSDVLLSAALLEWTYSNGSVINYTMTLENASQAIYTLSSIPAGTSTYYVYANDSAGTFGTSDMRTVTINDFAAPNLESFARTNSPIYNDATVIFYLNVSDTSLDSSAVYLESNYSGSLTNYTMLQENATRYNYTLVGTENLTVATNISYRFYASDLSGNENSSEAYSFFVINRPITALSVSYPSNLTQLEVGNSSVFNASASDEDNTGITYVWTWGDNTNVSSSTNTTTHTYNSTGAYTVILNASDVNSSLSTNVDVVVNDTTAPIASTLSYDSGVHIESEGTNVTVDLIAFDYSNVSSLRLYYNGSFVSANSSNVDTADWIFGNFTTAASLNFTIEYTDNSTQLNAINRTYDFSVYSCSDSSQNGDETGVDCGGSCSSACSSSSSSSGGGGGGGGGSSSSSSTSVSSTESSTSDSSESSSTTDSGNGLGVSEASSSEESGGVDESLEETLSEQAAAGSGSSFTLDIGDSSASGDFSPVVGEVSTITFSDALIAIKSAQISSALAVPANLAVHSFVDAPGDVVAKQGAYQYFDIILSGLTNDNLESVVIEFTVEKDWVEFFSINERRITLSTYEDGVWLALQTRLLSEDETHYTYEAEVPHFSYFVISGPRVGIFNNIFGAAGFIFGQGNLFDGGLAGKALYVYILLGLVGILLVLYFIIKKVNKPKDHFKEEFEEEYSEYDEY